MVWKGLATSIKVRVWIWIGLAWRCVTPVVYPRRSREAVRTFQDRLSARINSVGHLNSPGRTVITQCDSAFKICSPSSQEDEINQILKRGGGAKYIMIKKTFLLNHDICTSGPSTALSIRASLRWSAAEWLQVAGTPGKFDRLPVMVEFWNIIYIYIHISNHIYS